MSIKSTGMHHLALCTNNMEETVRFWTQVLGCPVVTTLHLPPVDPFAGLTWGDLADKKHYFFDIGNGDRIAFFDLKDETPETKNKGFAHHVALGVQSEPALLDAKKHLESHGVKVSDVIDHLFCKSIYFSDPNGVYMEYSVYTGNWTFETPFLQDANPVPSARKLFGDRYDKELRHFTAGHVDTYQAGQTAA
ncbi:MAG: Glyoxalase/bleomycin resistance protein/dioxygenase [Ramlibacter sp.]|nr:Glyoxalase/bleomycin resistance protein/dioxygenase [Ramlibacter sp.]